MIKIKSIVISKAIQQIKTFQALSYSQCSSRNMDLHEFIICHNKEVPNDIKNNLVWTCMFFDRSR